MSTSGARQRSLATHLQQVRALSRELASAISALERNDLPALQSSLALQENICSDLTAQAAAADISLGNLPNEIRDAHLELARLNGMYAALLRRSRRSAGLLTALYRYCSQGSSGDAPAVAKRQTWSCEV